MGNGKLENIEAIAFFVIITINGIIFSTSEIIFQSTTTSSLLNVICITALAFIVIYLFCRLLKQFSGKNLLDISNYLGRSCFKVYYWCCFYRLFYCKSFYFLKKNK